MAKQQGFYGTDEETYYVNARGEMYCVSSPDLGPTGQARRVYSLPTNVDAIDDRLCYDLEIPDEIR